MKSAISLSTPMARLALSALGLSLLFLPLLLPLTRFALASDLFSYTLLAPVVSIYLLFVPNGPRKDGSTGSPPSQQASAPSLILALGCFAAALLLALGPVRILWGSAPKTPAYQDWLAAGAGTYVLSLWACAAAVLGWQRIKEQLFPFLFLIALIPMPMAVETAVEAFLQHWSADAAELFFTLSGMTYFRTELTFHLPGISLEVAPECSGIHSSTVLFVTSLVAGYLFLKSPWRRATLTLVVIPLAIMRNGFRVWTLGELCVHVDREIINSALHHRGGPIFFALSLIPFSLLLWWLWRGERKQAPKA